MAKGKKNNTAREVPQILTSAELLKRSSEASLKNKALKTKKK